MINPFIPPDLQQNLINTIYLLFAHNYIVFAYFSGLLLSIVLSLFKPTRFTVFMLLGFAILLFSFEYDKHIIVPFRDQTLKSFITETPHYRLQQLIDLTISEILPIFFYILGWFFVYLGIIYGALKLGKKKPTQI